MQSRPRSTLFFATIGAVVSCAGAALAQQARPWQLGLQDPETEVMRDIVWFHNDILLPLITVITLFVLGLLVYVMWRFSEKRNPTPTRTTHNTLVEILWTAIPIVILVVIAVPSFKLLYKEDVVPPADLTIKAIGHQWYWSYEYPDNGGFTFDATRVADEDLKPDQKHLRLLVTDNTIVVPVGKIVKVLVTSQDVLHSWAMPPFGVKVDAVPGRINETWFRAEREGTFYGQCSELCGVDHGFMPIMVQVVSEDKFKAWSEDAKKRFAGDDRPAERDIALVRPAAQ